VKKLSVLKCSIEEKIFSIRGQKVMLDRDLAELYLVPTFRLNEQVKRNLKRFPPDFMFQLTPEELKILTSQFAISRFFRGRKGWGGRSTRPYVFSEQGIAMLSSVLNSDRAIQVNIHIMRAFVKIREFLTTHRDLQEKIKELEGKFDKKFAIVFQAIDLLMDGPETPVRVGGFENP